MAGVKESENGWFFLTLGCPRTPRWKTHTLLRGMVGIWSTPSRTGPPLNTVWPNKRTCLPFLAATYTLATFQNAVTYNGLQLGSSPPFTCPSQSVTDTPMLSNVVLGTGTFK